MPSLAYLATPHTQALGLLPVTHMNDDPVTLRSLLINGAQQLFPALSGKWSDAAVERVHIQPHMSKVESDMSQNGMVHVTHILGHHLYLPLFKYDIYMNEM